MAETPPSDPKVPSPERIRAVGPKRVPVPGENSHLLARARENQISAAVAVIAENRAVIEQVKGMLMLIYGIDEDRAFELLRWRSQLTNYKLRALAERLRHDFMALTSPHQLPTRAACDLAFIRADRPLGEGDDLAS